LYDDELSRPGKLGTGKLGMGFPRLGDESGNAEPPLKPVDDPGLDEPGPKPRLPAHPQSTMAPQTTAIAATLMAAPS
jgi:hypothetical protein